MHPYDRQLARLILSSRCFTADDLTANGERPLDPTHKPNAGQNGVGAYMCRVSRQGLIVWTGDVVRSQAPLRKGGAIRVWQGSTAGKRWARTVKE